MDSSAFAAVTDRSLIGSNPRIFSGIEARKIWTACSHGSRSKLLQGTFEYLERIAEQVLLLTWRCIFEVIQERRFTRSYRFLNRQFLEFVVILMAATSATTIRNDACK